MRRWIALGVAFAAAGCAARGRIANPSEVRELQQAGGLSASGQLTLSGPSGRIRTRVVLGMARPDALRIEIPAGASLRFLLTTNDGQLSAVLPLEGVRYDGEASPMVMSTLFGIDFGPQALVASALGGTDPGLDASWRFDRGAPSEIVLTGRSGGSLKLALDDVELVPPPPMAFRPSESGALSVSLDEMSRRLGLRR